MKFRLKTDVTFYAEDILHALKKIGQHFLDEGHGKDPGAVFIGEVTIEPVDDKETSTITKTTNHKTEEGRKK